VPVTRAIHSTRTIGNPVATTRQAPEEVRTKGNKFYLKKKI